MDFVSKNRTILYGLAATVLSALFFFIGTGLYPYWWATWLAPAPVLAFAARAPFKAAFLAAFLACSLGSMNAVHYLKDVIGLPTGVLLSFVVFPGLIFAGAVVFWRGWLRLERIWIAALALPCLWTSYEYLYSILSPHSTFGNIAYSQMNFLPLIQLASVTGIWGIVFVLLLVPGALVAILCSALPGAPRAKLAASTGAVVLLVCAFGVWRLHSEVKGSGKVSVRIITSGARQDVFAVKDQPALQLYRRYAQTISTNSNPPVDLILAPEKIAMITDSVSSETKSLFSVNAVQANSDVVVGFDEKRNGARRNEALLFAKDGSVQADYEKHHFIPVLEDGYVLGKDYVVFERPSGLWGIAICKDMDFPGLGREYGRRGVGLLIVPAWDFTIDAWYHDRMAVLRGVESGFTIARSAKQGLQTISDSRGRLLLDRPGSPDGFVVSDGLAPVAHVATLYAAWGDWFAWLCLAALLALIFLPRRRKATSV
ncbi:MAG TPA: nitrilase-related carbon-nitrogen hydrolase [Candidatus Saccharimonadales bacterium]|nr:nitrilase-related carbon-nitrogen hydrolase [Candidatus Saccharimonadales bacterium]